MNSRLPLSLHIGTQIDEVGCRGMLGCEVHQPGAQREGFMTRLDLSGSEFTLRIPYRIYPAEECAGKK